MRKGSQPQGGSTAIIASAAMSAERMPIVMPRHNPMARRKRGRKIPMAMMMKFCEPELTPITQEEIPRYSITRAKAGMV